MVENIPSIVKAIVAEVSPKVKQYMLEEIQKFLNGRTETIDKKIFTDCILSVLASILGTVLYAFNETLGEMNYEKVLNKMVTTILLQLHLEECNKSEFENQ